MKDWRTLSLLSIIIAAFIYMMSKDPWVQSLSYHNFVDSRRFLGISNTFDVLSNLPFLWIGIIGFCFTRKNKQVHAPYSWQIFFLGVAFVSVGSAYYHWTPENFTLIWDRLPMTIGFMALFVALLSEFVCKSLEKKLLIPMLIIGLSSVVYWAVVDDLRFYAWVQLAPLVTIPFILILYKGAYSHKSWYLSALAFYILAKVSESNDIAIYKFTKGYLSGHSLKHLLASLGPVFILMMLKRRKLK